MKNTHALMDFLLDILEHNGVAWPNARMFQNPIQAPAFMGVPAAISNMATVKHKRVASTSNINLPMAFGGLATPPFPSQLNHYGLDTNGNGNYDASSRSTSAYSILTDSAAPLLKKDALAPAYPATYPETVRKMNQQFNIRLPSDQLDMIIKAIQVPHQTQHIGDQASTMPPPPLPQHVTPVKENFPSEKRATSFGLTFPAFGESGTNGTNGTTTINRRDDSRFSDISMHQGCTSFPSCTTEDAEGHIMHSTNCAAGNNAPGAPATVVRGRKEGSSPTKRKSSSSSSTKEDNPKAKKRTRRSSRLLQHDPGYDGSGESSSDRAVADADAVARASVDGDGSAAAGVADVEQSRGSAGD